MSTLKVENIQHTNGTNAIAIRSDGIITKNIIPMLKVGLSSAATISAGSGKVPFDSFNNSLVFDPEDNMSAFNTSTNTYTIPSGLGGLWFISCHVYSSSNNPNQIAVNVNGTREDAIGTDNGVSNMNQGAITKRFSAGDEIQMWVFNASQVIIQPNTFHTYWQMNFIG
tara:strand:- start:242 stop:745 length:504 start_codon:yes stop_codon:yes gene_type:complete